MTATLTAPAPISEGTFGLGRAALAEEIAANAPLTVRMMKRSVMQGLNLEIEKAAEWEAKNQAITFTTEDSKEGIDALLTKRKPHFTGQ